MTAQQIANQAAWKNKLHLKQQRKSRWWRAIGESIGWLLIVGAGAGILRVMFR